MTLPINDTIVAAVAKLVDDAKLENKREPTHSDIDFYVARADLMSADPKVQGQAVGKAKRVRAVLSWAMDNRPAAGAKLVEDLLAKVRAVGGFRENSPNYVGAEAIRNAITAFEPEGYVLSSDGTIQPKVLDGLRGHELTDALQAYARRAQKGAEDAALLSGTGKDLLEATAAHIIQSRWGSYPTGANFRTLLGQAYVAIGLTVPEQEPQSGEHPIKAFERSMFQAACAINALRNKQGTGHGRPWLPNLSEADSRAAVEMVGCISGFLLEKLRFMN